MGRQQLLVRSGCLKRKEEARDWLWVAVRESSPGLYGPSNRPKCETQRAADLRRAPLDVEYPLAAGVNALSAAQAARTLR